jgi:hypothetical protein
MKKVITSSILFLVIMASSAQQYNNTIPKSNSFKQENIFIGGSLGLGGGSGGFSIGANPEIGYSFNQWFDAGVALNINYTTQNYTDIYSNNIKYKTFNYGAGIFARVWPVNFLFIQVQPEYNFIHYSTNINNTGNVSNTINAASLLAGVGYGGKFIGSHYSYLVLMIDLLNNPNSPYRDYYNNVLPVFRGGFGFYLHPSKKR